MSSDESNTTAIAIRGLGKRYEIYDRPPHRLWQFLWRGRKQFYREFWALHDVDFNVQRGETVGIVGRNGAGKTTLLQCIAGTLTPTLGSVVINGRVTALLELGSGFNPEFTGRENVQLNGAILGMSRKEIEEKFDRIAAFADIGDFIERPVKTYSKGMFVRLAFSVMANLDPDIFIVDEALAVGDAYFQHRCMLRFHEMKEQGTTILYVSHSAGAMKQLCDRVVWLDGGRVQKQGEPDEVVDAYLINLFKQDASASPVQPSKPMTAAQHAPELPKSPKPTPEKNATAASLPEIFSEPETHLPNIDRRVGDGACVIQGVGLYDEAGEIVRVVNQNRTVVFRVTVKNTHLPAEVSSLCVGYILRNRHGEDLAATNTRIENIPVPLPAPGIPLTVAFTLHLPRLCRGSYSLTAAVAYEYETDSGAMITGDRIDNALVFDLHAPDSITGKMAIDTTIAIIEHSASSTSPPNPPAPVSCPA